MSQASTAPNSSTASLARAHPVTHTAQPNPFDGWTSYPENLLSFDRFLYDAVALRRRLDEQARDTFESRKVEVSFLDAAGSSTPLCYEGRVLTEEVTADPNASPVSKVCTREEDVLKHARPDFAGSRIMSVC